MKDKILQILRKNKGHSVSGEELSRRMGVSRTAVWKHVQALRGAGHQINSRSKVGYVLVNSPELLYPGEIKEKIGDSVFGRQVIYQEEVMSTNTMAKAAADQGAVHGTVVMAERQLAGRGRRGRDWSSDNNKGVWVSLILRPVFAPLLAPKLTFVAAIALVGAVEKTSGLCLAIKWPNDLYYRGKKVAGILTEMKAELDAIEYVVIGVGLNVNQGEEEFPVSLKDIATSLRVITGGEFCRQDLVVAFLQEMEHWYNIFQTGGFAPVLDRWKQYDLTTGKQVVVKETSREYQGLARSVDHEGNLLVEDEEGVLHKVIAGEVSILVEK